uniref:Uncharacterized protein n=1 Tax=Setaria viridis TaxID=4556 RepID=A0A4U6W4Z7_SETVI|nr:hypothetical protein SEVIR_1G007600v2 [Setaria viridis]
MREAMTARRAYRPSLTTMPSEWRESTTHRGESFAATPLAAPYSTVILLQAVKVDTSAQASPMLAGCHVQAWVRRSVIPTPEPN